MATTNPVRLSKPVYTLQKNSIKLIEKTDGLQNNLKLFPFCLHDGMHIVYFRRKKEMFKVLKYISKDV